MKSKRNTHKFSYVKRSSSKVLYSDRMSKSELFQTLSKDFEEMRLEKEIRQEDFISQGYGPHESIIDFIIDKIEEYNFLDFELPVIQKKKKGYSTNKVHMKDGKKILCNSGSPFYSIESTEDEYDVTCKTCLKIIKAENK